MNPEEKVLVIPRKKFFGENDEYLFEGYKDIEDYYLNQINQNTFFMKRGHAEEDPSHLQVIAFIIVKKADKIFVIQKLDGTGDKREIGLYSLAVGGHINPIDGGENTLIDGAAREFKEEVAYSKDFNGKLVGFVNSEVDVFNKVHFGAIFVQEVDEEVDVHPNESHKQRGEWMDINRLKEVYSQFGPWSQNLIDNIEKFL